MNDRALQMIQELLDDGLTAKQIADAATQMSGGYMELVYVRNGMCGHCHELQQQIDRMNTR